MATQIAVDVEGISGALKLSLENWVKGSKKYAALYNSLEREVKSIAHAALDEMVSIKPGSWEVWWAVNHNRFIRNRKVKQLELLILHEVMYHFLTDFSRGRLHAPKAHPSAGKIKNNRKAEV